MLLFSMTTVRYALLIGALATSAWASLQLRTAQESRAQDPTASAVPDALPKVAFGDSPVPPIKQVAPAPLSDAVRQAYAMYQRDTSNPFSMNFAGEPSTTPDNRITIDYARACQLADELGTIEHAFEEKSGDLSRCEKTVSRPVSNDRIQVEVLAYKGLTENIAATVWLDQGMTARQALLTYEQLFQYLAYQFSQDTLGKEIYHIQNRNQVHFRSAGGGFVGLLSYSYAHLQFSYSR